MDDPFVRHYDAGELEIAAEFLTNWLPFLTHGLCDGCSAALRGRIDSLHHQPPPPPVSSSAAAQDPTASGPRGFEQIEPTGWDTEPEPPSADQDPAPAPENPAVRMSWADMAQEDELEEEEGEEGRGKGLRQEGEDGSSRVVKKKTELSREQRERIRFGSVGRKKDFICLERVNGRIVNILSGIELHKGVFSLAEQKRIVDFVYDLQEKGRNKQLGEDTYSEPRKWMRGKGRVTIQFGCCYNYAMKDGNPPGILQKALADPLPPLFKVIIRRLVQWHVLPTSCIPDSCIVNIYEPGDCIPPHIDSHDFVRPFCTVSFLSECDILFGSDLKIIAPGEFAGSTAIPLPVGSVLVLNGNGADVAKHCVPAVPTKRISITFRKMDEGKWPTNFTPEPDLQNILPLPYDSDSIGSQNDTSKTGSHNKQPEAETKGFKKGKKSRGRPSRMMPEQDVEQTQHLAYDPDETRKGSTRQDAGERLPLTGNDSMYSGREYVGRWPKQNTSKPSLLGAVPRQIDFSELGDGSSQKVPPDDESRFKGSREHNGRRVRLEQKRIVISCKVAGENEFVQGGPSDEDGGSRSVRLEHKRMLISRDMEAQREPVQQGQRDESSSHLDSGSREYVGRRVSLVQKHGMIGRRAGVEQDAQSDFYSIDPSHNSRVSVRTLNNGRRRGRASLSDG